MGICKDTVPFDMTLTKVKAAATAGASPTVVPCDTLVGVVVSDCSAGSALDETLAKLEAAAAAGTSRATTTAFATRWEVTALREPLRAAAIGGSNCERA